MRIDDVEVGEHYWVDRSYSVRGRVRAEEIVTRDERIGSVSWRTTRKVRFVKVIPVDTETGKDLLYDPETGEPSETGKPNETVIAARDLDCLWSAYEETHRRFKEQQRRYTEATGQLLAALDHTIDDPEGYKLGNGWGPRLDIQVNLTYKAAAKLAEILNHAGR